MVSSTIPVTAATFYRETLEELRDRGFEVHVVTSPGPQVASLADVSHTVHLLPMYRGVSPLKDLVGLVRWIVLLLRLRPVVVLGGTPKAGLLSMMAARITGVSQRTYLLQGLRLEGSTRHAAPDPGAVRADRQLLQPPRGGRVSLTGQRVRAARPQQRAGCRRTHHGSSHGVDTEHFTPRPRDAELAASLDLVADVPVVVFIGRLTADKGPDTLIRALTSVAERDDALQLLVLGPQDEPDSQVYLHRLEQLGDRVRVRVLDHIDDVRPYLALSDLLVLPTKREGLPNVVLEAAAMGKPAVTTTATGAIDSVIDGETGLLVGPDDGDGMGRAIESLAGDAALRERHGTGQPRSGGQGLPAGRRGACHRRPGRGRPDGSQPVGAPRRWHRPGDGTDDIRGCRAAPLRRRRDR